MAKTSANFWLGFIIGLLAALLVATLIVLFVPRLRPIIGEFGKPVPSANVPVVGEAIANVPVNKPAGVTQVAPQTAENIRVTTPENDDSISNPVIIRGEARVFEGTVELRVRDGDGRVLAETFTTAEAADVGLFGPFEISLKYQEPDYDSGSIEVFATSPKDGSEIDKVIIPVSF